MSETARGAFLDEVPRILAEHEWVFVVGCNNSGTTLVHDVLAATGEFSFMRHEGQRYTRALRPVPRLLFDWLEALGTPLSPRILEKTTANAVRMRWLHQAFPRSAFIGVVRNGYAVAEGIRRKGTRK